jgi:surface protein
MTSTFQDTSACYVYNDVAQKMVFKHDLHAWDTKKVINRTSFFRFLEADLTEIDINSPFYTNEEGFANDLIFNYYSFPGDQNLIVLPISDIRAPGIYITWNNSYSKFYKPGDTNISGSNTLAKISIWGEFGKFGNGSSTWAGASSFQNFTRFPRGLTSFSGAFNGATTFTGGDNLFSIGYWDVSGVTDMSYMFTDAIVFNQDLSGWNTSNVTDMSNMFYDASGFNRPLATWNTSKVTTMSGMFRGATAFNQPLVSWDVSGVRTMESMFREASAFNQPLASWNVSQVTTMVNMFGGATAFNRPLATWNTSNVIIMQGMFFEASAFNQDLSGWNVSQVVNMTSMFREASAFNQDLSGWNVSKVTDMSSMFNNTSGCYDGGNYRYNLTRWNVEKVRSADNFFRFNSINTTTTDPNSPFKIELVLSSPFTVVSVMKMDTKTYGIYTLDASSVLFDVSNQEIITYLEGTPKSNLKRMGSILYGANELSSDGKVFSGKVFGFNTATNSLQYYDLSGSPQSTVLKDGNTLYISDTSKNIWALSSASQTMTLFKTLEENAGQLRYEQNALYFRSSGNTTLPGLLTSQPIDKLDISSRNVTTLDISAYTNLQSFVVDSSGTVYFFDNAGVYSNDQPFSDVFLLSSYSSSGYSRLWNFSTDPSVGTTPVGSLILDYSLTKEPILYGMCQGGGRYDKGTVWQYYRGNMTVLYDCLSKPIAIDKINEYNLMYVVMNPNPGTIAVRPYGRFGVRAAPDPSEVDDIPTPDSETSCFNRGTKILCKGEWKQIETLRCGDLVQTYKHGYRPITNIGKGSFINEPSIWHTCMYQGQKEGHEPLIITGGHSLLVDYLSLEEQEAQSVFWGRGEEVIDDKLLMIAPVSPEFKQITDNKVYTYYHFTVQNDGDNDRRYGVWANGFLTETPSENQYKLHKYHNL